MFSNRILSERNIESTISYYCKGEHDKSALYCSNNATKFLILKYSKLLADNDP